MADEHELALFFAPECKTRCPEAFSQSESGRPLDFRMGGVKSAARFAATHLRSESSSRARNHRLNCDQIVPVFPLIPTYSQRGRPNYLVFLDLVSSDSSLVRLWWELSRARISAGTSSGRNRTGSRYVVSSIHLA